MMNHRHLSEPCLTIISFNVEGISPEKQEIISNICERNSCDVLCLQETHRGPLQNRPKIPGMTMAKEIMHEQYGSSIFVRPGIEIKNVKESRPNNIELITVGIGSITISSIYKPPNENFTFTEQLNHPHVVIGDFNCHSKTWGYRETSGNGDLLESWAEENEMSLIHNQKQPASFNSGRWERGYNPDLIFASKSVAGSCEKTVLDPIPHSQHRPIMLKFRPVIMPQKVPFKRRFNFKKANWIKFAKELDEKIVGLPPTTTGYENFISTIKKVARCCIPRGCRTLYIPGFSDESRNTYEDYLENYSRDPFSQVTIQLGHQLMDTISKERQATWRNTIEALDMRHSSRKAWRLINKLSNDPTASTDYTSVTANEIAHQLLLNGKPDQTAKRTTIPRNGQELEHVNDSYFTSAELQTAIKSLKNNKAPGPDDIPNEFLKNLGPLALQWLTHFYNSCWRDKYVPKLWLKAKVVAVPKPGKPRNEAKSYRPISLLCSPFKLYERLILNKIGPQIESNLVPQQAGFRPKKSCTAQVLNLTQHIEDGFERRKKTGVVFVDLSAAYDTINHKILLRKIFDITGNLHLMKVIKSILSNRRFYVEFQGKKSRWRKQKNGLPQGSVLSPILFNVYTNDQPIGPTTSSFIYADDVAISCQSKKIEDIERNLTDSLSRLTEYYRANQLRPNPAKTQTCIFHLNNKEANKELEIHWNSVRLHHCANPVYLGVTLDRTLTYKKHIDKTKAKVNSRNGILRKLSSSRWGANPNVLRSSALALCYAPAEYACPVWGRSTHAQKMDPVLNDACRLITGCLKPTNLDHLHMLAGIAPPRIRRETLSMVERGRQISDVEHPLYNYQPQTSRLKSRRSFLQSTNPLVASKADTIKEKWELHLAENNIPNWNTTGKLPAGSEQEWETWKSLNRLRCGMGRSRNNLQKWGYTEDDSCECGQLQTMEHLLTCQTVPAPCTAQDLWLANKNAVMCARHWKSTI